MTDIAAAIGLTQINKLDKFNNQRRENASYLTSQLENVKGIKVPSNPEGRKHVFHQYTIRIAEHRDKFQEFLTENGIGTGIHYPIVQYKQPYYQNNGYTGNCPLAEKAASEVLSIPVHPSLTREDLDTVIDVIKQGSEKLLQ